MVNIDIFPTHENIKNRDEESIKYIQDLLDELGFDPQGNDGKFGNNSIQALKAFQKDFNAKFGKILQGNTLKEDGQIDTNTLLALKISNQIEMEADVMEELEKLETVMNLEQLHDEVSRYISRARDTKEFNILSPSIEEINTYEQIKAYNDMLRQSQGFIASFMSLSQKTQAFKNPKFDTATQTQESLAFPSFVYAAYNAQTYAVYQDDIIDQKTLTSIEKLTAERFKKLLPIYKIFKNIDIDSRTEDQKNFIELFESEMKMWEDHQIHHTTAFHTVSLTHDFDISLLQTTDIDGILTYTTKQLEMYSRVNFPGSKTRLQWQEKIEDIQKIIWVKLAELKSEDIQLFRKKCLDVASIFSAKRGDEDITSSLLDVQFAADILKEVIEFDALAQEHAEKRFNPEVLPDPYHETKLFVEAHRGDIEKKIQISQLPERNKQDGLDSIDMLLTNEPQSLEEFVTHFALLRGIQAMYQGETKINIPQELDIILGEYFEDWLDGGWLSGGKNSHDIESTFGKKFTHTQKEAYQLLSNIEGYGYKLSEDTFSTIKIGGKMLAAGIGISVLCMSLGPIAFALAGGAAMTGAGAVIMNKGIDDISDPQEWWDTYGADFIINTLGFGFGRVVFSGRYAVQASRAGKGSLSHSFKEGLFASSYRGLLSGRHAFRGQSLPALMSEVDQISLSLRLKYGLGEGIADYAIMTPGQAAVYSTMYDTNFMDQLYEALTDPMNFGFIGLGALEVTPALFKSMSMMGSRNLRKIQTIFQEAEDLKKELQISALKHNLSWDEVSRNPQILLDSISAEEKSILQSKIKRLKSIGGDFQQIIQHSLNDTLLFPIAFRKSIKKVDEAEMVAKQMEKLQHTTEKLAYTRFPLQQQAKMTAHVQSKLAEYHIEKPEQLIRSMEEYMTWLSIKPVERKGKIYPGNAFSEIMTVIESYGDLHGFSNDMNAVLPAMDTSLPRKIDVLPSPIMWRNVNLVNKILGNTARVPGYVIHKFGLSTLGELVIGAVSVQASKTGFQSYMEAGDFWSYAVGVSVGILALIGKRSFDNMGENTGNSLNIYNPKQSGIKGPIVNTLAAAALVISASSMYEGLTKGAIAPIEATNIATITQNKLIDFRNTDFNVTQSGIPDYLSSTFRSQLLGVVEDEAGGIAVSGQGGFGEISLTKMHIAFGNTLSPEVMQELIEMERRIHPKIYKNLSDSVAHEQAKKEVLRIWNKGVSNKNYRGIVDTARRDGVLPSEGSVVAFLNQEWNTLYTQKVQGEDLAIDALYKEIEQEINTMSHFTELDAYKGIVLDGKTYSITVLKDKVDTLIKKVEDVITIYNEASTTMNEKMQNIKQVYIAIERQVNSTKDPNIDIQIPKSGINIESLRNIQTYLNEKVAAFNGNNYREDMSGNSFNPISVWKARGEKFDTLIEESLTITDPLARQRAINHYNWLKIIALIDLGVIVPSFFYKRHRGKITREQLPEARMHIKKWEEEFIKNITLYCNNPEFRQRYPGLPVVGEDFIHFAFKSFMQKKVRDINPRQTATDNVSSFIEGVFAAGSPGSELKNYNDYVTIIHQLVEDSHGLRMELLDEIFPGMKQLQDKALRVLETGETEQKNFPTRAESLYSITQSTIQKQINYTLLREKADAIIKGKLKEEKVGVRAPAQLKNTKTIALAGGVKMDANTRNTLYRAFFETEDIPLDSSVTNRDVLLEQYRQDIEGGGNITTESPEVLATGMRLKKTILRLNITKLVAAVDTQGLSVDDWLILSSISKIKAAQNRREGFNDAMVLRLQQVSDGFAKIFPESDVTLNYEVKPATTKQKTQAHFVLNIKRPYQKTQRIVIEDMFQTTAESIISNIEQKKGIVSAIKQLNVWNSELRTTLGGPIKNDTVLDIREKQDIQLLSQWQTSKRIEILEEVVKGRIAIGETISEVEFKALSEGLSPALEISNEALKVAQDIITHIGKGEQLPSELQALRFHFQLHTGEFIISHPDYPTHFKKISVRNDVINYDDFIDKVEGILKELTNPEVAAAYFSNDITEVLRTSTGIDTLSAEFSFKRNRSGSFAITYTPEGGFGAAKTFKKIDIQDPTNPEAIERAIGRWLDDSTNPLYTKIAQSANERVIRQSDFHGRKLKIVFAEGEYRLIETLSGEEKVQAKKKFSDTDSLDASKIAEFFLQKIGTKDTYPSL